MTNEQLAADYSNPAFLSDVMLAAAITDEDIETYIKFSYTNGGTVWREVLAEAARRLTHKLRCASGIAEVVRRDDVERRIWTHYEHAREKHPYFCDTLLPPVMKRFPDFWDDLLRGSRGELYEYMRGGCVPAKSVFKCELSEMEAAIAHDDTAAAVEEAYDCIAVLLRVIDVLEGRQKLGKPEGQPEAVKCDHGPKVRLVSVEHSYRPATEDEVKNGKAAWCHACQSVCINRGKDALVVCDGFTTPFPPEEGADA